MSAKSNKNDTPVLSTTDLLDAAVNAFSKARKNVSEMQQIKANLQNQKAITQLQSVQNTNGSTTPQG